MTDRVFSSRHGIAQIHSISAAPAILQPLLGMMRLPADDIQIEKVVELVSRDGAIAAHCLRIANSPSSDAAWSRPPVAPS